jgi:hypothetical protein
VSRNIHPQPIQAGGRCDVKGAQVVTAKDKVGGIFWSFDDAEAVACGCEDVDAPWTTGINVALTVYFQTVGDARFVSGESGK